VRQASLEATKLLPAGDRALEFSCRSLVAAPENDDRFDVVLLRDVLHHRTHQDAVMAAAVRHLRPGGLLVCVDWVQRRTMSRETWGALLDRIWSTDLRTETDYRALASRARLDDIRTESLDDEMHRFFAARRAALSREIALDSGRGDAARSSDALLERSRALSDIGMLEELSRPGGSLGWMVLWARRPEDGGGPTT
jgi:SAM-dependent methyltransferase